MHKSKIEKQMLNNSTSPAILPMQCYMPCLSHGSLFSGIGGFDLAAQWMGWNNIFQVEKDDWCRKVLAKNFPKTERFADIKDFTGHEYTNRIDVISGGFPCQPFSVAGQRKGKDDDRYLWEEMLRVIKTIKPTYVVGENVAGIINMALDTVLSDLEELGYSTEAFVIPACAIGAAHRRDRVWVIAYNVQQQCYGWPDWYGGGKREQVEVISNVWRRRGEKNGMWNVEPSICRSVDGLPERLDKNLTKRIQGLGNAIVPQIAYEIFSAIGAVFRHGA